MSSLELYLYTEIYKIQAAFMPISHFLNHALLLKDWKKPQ